MEDILQTDGQTDRQTDNKNITYPLAITGIGILSLLTNVLMDSWQAIIAGKLSLLSCSIMC